MENKLAVKSGPLAILSGMIILTIATVDNEYVTMIGLTIVGLCFLQGTDMNGREVIAMVLLGSYGMYAYLEYSYAAILPALAGLMLIIGTFGQHNDVIMVMKVLIGIFFTWAAFWPPLLFANGIMMILLGILYLTISAAEGSRPLLRISMPDVSDMWPSR